MSILDRIKHAIFGEAHAAPATQSATPSTTSPSLTPGSPAASPTPTTPELTAAASTPAQSSGQPQQANGDVATGARAGDPVDVETILEKAVKKSGQKLDWRHSIVDLMKALGMDASLEEREELAQELGYSGDVHDSAKMNTFLHKALMKKLSENGGKVPADLLD